MLVYRTYLLHILPLFRDEIIILQSHLPMPAKIRVKMGDRLEGIVDPAITRFEQGCEAGEGPCQLHSSASPRHARRCLRWKGSSRDTERATDHDE